MGPMKGLRPGVKGMAKYAVSLAQPVGAATTDSASFRRIYRCAFALFELLSKSLCQNRKDYERQGRYMEQGRVNKWRAPILALGLPLSVSMVSVALALGNDQDYSNHFGEKAKSEELAGKMSESFTVERLNSMEAVRSGKTRLHVDFSPHMAPSLKSHRVFS